MAHFHKLDPPAGNGRVVSANYNPINGPATPLDVQVGFGCIAASETEAPISRSEPGMEWMSGEAKRQRHPRPAHVQAG